LCGKINNKGEGCAFFRPFKIVDLESTVTVPLFRLREGEWEEKVKSERNSNFSELLQRGSGEITSKRSREGLAKVHDGPGEGSKQTYSSTVSNNRQK